VTKVVVCGALGRMGRRVVELSRSEKDIELVGTVETKGHPGVGLVVSENVELTDSIEKVIETCDVLVDFTQPESAVANVGAAYKAKKAVVVGTTGFSGEQREALGLFTKEIPCVIAPNMSLGVNLLFSLVVEVARVLAGYDIEIIETHHKQKKDAPSGTAMEIARKVCDVYGWNIDDVAKYGRKGMIGVRKPKEIGIHSIRSGDVIGEHQVIFAGNNERLELVHRAHSRDAFARGALVAAKWIVGREPGWYDMSDVLGFKNEMS